MNQLKNSRGQGDLIVLLFVLGLAFGFLVLLLHVLKFAWALA